MRGHAQPWALTAGQHDNSTFYSDMTSQCHGVNRPGIEVLHLHMHTCTSKERAIQRGPHEPSGESSGTSAICVQLMHRHVQRSNLAQSAEISDHEICSLRRQNLASRRPAGHLSRYLSHSSLESGDSACAAIIRSFTEK
jgi:hypothetical protein